MGKTNLLYGLENKIGKLMGELAAKKDEIERIEQLAEQLPAMRERLWELETLIEATETLIKSDHPNWTRDTIDPVRPFVHQIPVRLGNASRVAMDVLRTASDKMTVREIAREVLRREGHEDPTTVTIDKVSNTIGQALKKRRGKVVESDGQWPARWWATQS